MNFRCPNCRLISVSPTPSTEALADYYASAYVVDPEGYRRNLERFGTRDIELLENSCKHGYLLEIGSSWGGFLQIASDHGWQVKGVELAEPAAAFARNNRQLEIFSGTVEEFATPQELGSYDVVVAWHVIEHTPDPVAFLQAARDLLRPNGFIALRTPNIRSLPALLNGENWQWVGAPAHLSLFSRKAIVRILEQSGFGIAHLATRRGDAHNPLFELLRGTAVKLSVHRRVKEILGLAHQRRSSDASGVDASAGRRSVILRRMSWLFDLALFPVIPIEKLLDVCGFGAELFVIAQRQ